MEGVGGGGPRPAGEGARTTQSKTTHSPKQRLSRRLGKYLLEGSGDDPGCRSSWAESASASGAAGLGRRRTAELCSAWTLRLRSGQARRSARPHTSLLSTFARRICLPSDFPNVPIER
jgi:hypothetical protein